MVPRATANDCQEISQAIRRAITPRRLRQEREAEWEFRRLRHRVLAVFRVQCGDGAGCNRPLSYSLEPLRIWGSDGNCAGCSSSKSASDSFSNPVLFPA